MSFYEQIFYDRLYLKSDIFDDTKITHAFTTRLGGVSRGNICGLNLGFRVKDNTESVKENYRLVANDMGLDLDKAILSKQSHTDNIHIVTQEDFGKGITRQSDIEDTDALVTNVQGAALVVFAADCTPILLYDPIQKVAAAIHSGWRGSVKKIAPKCVGLMETKFGSNPRNILVAIGPCIGQCCFEFGSDAPDYFDAKHLKYKENGKYMVNLRSYITNSMISVGIDKNNIDISNACTMCNTDRFYSYRAHRDKTGRQAAIIMIK